MTKNRIGAAAAWMMAVILLPGCTFSNENTIVKIEARQTKEQEVEKEQDESISGQSQEELIYLPNDTFTVEEPVTENLAGLLQEKAAGVMVQINTGELIGSGIIWSMNTQSMVIVTAAHVIENAQKLEITLIDGTMLESRNNLWNWRTVSDCDLGIITIPMEEIPEEALSECRYVSVDKEAYDNLQTEDIILVMGSRDSVAGNAYAGKLVESWIYMEDYTQYMMLATTYARPGMSGGGVFDQNGQFIGILSGADEQGNLAILPLSLILREVD